MTEYLLASILMFAGFLAALAAVPCIISGLRLIRRKEGFLPYIFYSSNFTNAAAIISSDRNLFIFSEDSPLATLPPHLAWLGRINSALIVFASCQRLTRPFISPKAESRAPTALLIAFVIYFVTNAVTAAFFSSHPSIQHDYFYLLFAGSAALLFTEGEEVIAIRAARNAYFILLTASVGFLVLNPSLVLSSNYLTGFIPGFTFRYAGLAPHANSLGMMISLFFVCLANKPFANRWLNFVAWVMGFLSLLACQSKTNWIAIIVALACISYFNYGAFIKRRFFDFKKPIVPALFIFALMTIATALTGIIMFGELGGKIDTLLSSRAGSELLSLSGRDLIWDVALNEWHNSPLFGYGLTIWDEAHRAKIGLPNAVSAHGQFYQSLASAGIFGVFGLFVYVVTLCWFSLKTAKSSKGLTLALFSMILFRSISETPLTPINHFHADGLTHVLLLMVIAAQFKATAVSRFAKRPETYDLPIKERVIHPFKLTYNTGEH
jgi:O-antigen ligase